MTRTVGRRQRARVVQPMAALAMDGEFKIYLPVLLPNMLQLFDNDEHPTRQPTLEALSAFKRFGQTLEEYLHLVVPVLVRQMERTDVPLVLRKVRGQACARQHGDGCALTQTRWHRQWSCREGDGWAGNDPNAWAAGSQGGLCRLRVSGDPAAAARARVQPSGFAVGVHGHALGVGVPARAGLRHVHPDREQGAACVGRTSARLAHRLMASHRACACRAA